MGWTSYHVEPMYDIGRQYINRKAECDRLFSNVTRDSTERELV